MVFGLMVVEPRRLELEVLVGEVTEVRREPCREPCLDMLLVTELREALELDLLRFSFELVGRLLVPFF